MLDTHFINIGQIYHKLWLLPLFLPFLPLLLMKECLKNITNIFNGFRRGLNIYLDTNFMNPD